MPTTIVRPGQINGAGDVRTQFRDIAQAEVMEVFETSTIMAGRHRVINITEGQSASFPHTGRAEADYHLVGDELQGGVFKNAPTKIIVDDELLSNYFTSKIDEKMLDFNIREPITKAMGVALAKRFDSNVLQVGILSARSANVVDGLPGGTVVDVAGCKTDAKKLAAGIYAVREALDNKGISADAMFVYVTPGSYYALVQNLDAINTQWGGMGSYANGTIVKIAGIEIVMVPGNTFPNKNLATDAAITAAAIPGMKPSNVLAKYRGDFSKTVALVMERDAVGTVKLFDVAYSVDWIPLKRLELHVASYVIGHGKLRPECAAEITDSTAV